MAVYLTKPFEVAYPVRFVSGGDTTKDAFGKHIQEIERIYGILSALNADKISLEDFEDKLSQHVNSSNPHPNLDIGNTQGFLPTSRITGNFDFSRIEGDLPLSRTTGNLDGSRISGNIDRDKINGLESYIKGLIDDADNGFQTTSNGAYLYVGDMLIQFGNVYLGKMGPGNSKKVTVNLPKAYKTALVEGGGQDGLYNVIASAGSGFTQTVQIGFDRRETYFSANVVFQGDTTYSDGTWSGERYLVWFAFGIKA